MKKVDLVVVGGGILGTFHAYHALNKGLKVLLIEKDVKSKGSTIQNFGQVVPSGLDGKWFEYGLESLKIYSELQTKFDLTVRKNGSVYIASDAEELQVIEELSGYYDNKKYENLLQSQKGTLAKYPFLNSDYVKGSLYFPNELSVEPDKMIYHLQEYMVANMDLEFMPNTTVIDCFETNSEVSIVTNYRDTIHASKLLICSGFESQILFPDIIQNSGLIISKLQMMRTIPIPEIDMKGNILTGMTIRRYEAFQHCESYKTLKTTLEIEELAKYGIHILFKQAIDGSIIVGDSHEYSKIDETYTLGISDKTYINNLILKASDKILKFKISDKIAQTWSGQYSQTPKEIFDYDVSENIKILTGIGGKGMTSSAGFSKHNIQKMF
jgi:D-hydroxyproline dehydrogenase subunit beta